MLSSHSRREVPSQLPVRRAKSSPSVKGEETQETLRQHVHTADNQFDCSSPPTCSAKSGPIFFNSSRSSHFAAACSLFLVPLILTASNILGNGRQTNESKTSSLFEHYLKTTGSVKHQEFPHASRLKNGNILDEIGVSSNRHTIQYASPTKRNGEPSGVILCRALLSTEYDKKETSPTEWSTLWRKREAKEIELEDKERVLIVEEDEMKCHDREFPYTSLMTIFASSLLAEVAQDTKKAVHYHHGCGTRMMTANSIADADAIKSNSWLETATMQQMLPPILKFPENENRRAERQLLESCGSCIGQYDDESSISLADRNGLFLSCLLNPIGSSETKLRPSRDIMLDLLPALKTNLRLAAVEWRDYIRTLRGTGLWWDVGIFGDNEFETQLQVPRADGAIIYLDSTQEVSAEETTETTRALFLPFYVYARYIPRSATNIQIFLSPECGTAVHLPECFEHGRDLRRYLQTVFPEKVVSLDVAGSRSSAELQSRMILARHLLGPPSLSSILPAISKGQYTTVAQSRDLYPWLDNLRANYDRGELRENQDLSGMTFLLEWEVPSLPLMQGEWDTAFYPPSNHGSGQCRHLRGRVGHWIQDLDYAKHAQYVTPIRGYAGKADRVFRPQSPEDLFRLPTTYKWVESAQFFGPACEFDLLSSLDGLCAVLDSLNISRIVFVGDSLTYHWSQSFWKLLGNIDSPGDDTPHATHEDLSWRRVISCPATGTADEEQPSSTYKTIQVQYYRNDELNDISTPIQYGEYNCGIDTINPNGYTGHCIPWVNDYISDASPTLLLVNAGAHSVNEEIFRSTFDAFVKLVNDMGRPSDIVFFRTTVPGHRDCLVKNIRPYRSYGEYANTTTDGNRWNQFPAYNDYAARILEDRAERKGKLGVNNAGATIAPARAAATIELLDVYPMTVLRPDGHASGIDCRDCGLRKGKKGDCLSYSLPGPIDWWNHLLYSNLKDIATEKENSQKTWK